MGKFALVTRLVVCVVALGAVSFGAPVYQNWFNTAPLPLPGGTQPFLSYFNGDTFQNDWVVGGHSIDHLGSYFWQAPPTRGPYSVDLGGQLSGSILTVVSGLTPGVDYVLSFWATGNPQWQEPWADPSIFPNPGPIKTMKFSIGSASGSLSFDTTGYSSSNMGWVFNTFPFTADNTSMPLVFSDNSGFGPFGAVLAGVQINSAIPEPATMALLGGALLGIALLRRRAVR